MLPVTAGWNDAASYATQDKAFTVRGMFKGEACSATVCAVKKVDNRLDLKDVQHTRVRLQLRFWTVGTWGKSSSVEYGKAFVDNTMVWEAPRDSSSQCVAASGTGDRQWIEYGGSFGVTSAPVLPTYVSSHIISRLVSPARLAHYDLLCFVTRIINKPHAILSSPLHSNFNNTLPLTISFTGLRHPHAILTQVGARQGVLAWHRGPQV